jgi:predicted transcriptional regulator YdeE
MMTPTPTEHEALIVVGIDTTTSNAVEGDSARAQIPRLWARYFAEDVLSRIPGKKQPALPVGAYTDYESDHTGAYRVVAGAAVADGVEPPEGLVRVTLPAGRYLVFSGEGPMPETVIQTWMGVWRYFAEPRDFVRAYTGDFELYRGPNLVEIHIGVR